jgi:tetratricopeptide (TPR) repeat protein
MRKIFYLCIVVLQVAACKNGGNDKINIKTSKNQNKTPIDTLMQAIKGNERNKKFLDTTKYRVVKTEYNARAIKLNNKAIELYSYVGGEPVSIHDSLLLDSALFLLNKAIKIDTQYYLAYANKAMILGKFKKYSEAIEVFDDIVKIRPYYAEGIANQGFLFEKIGNYNKAKEKYQESIKAYLLRMNNSYKINDKANIQADIAFMLLFIEGKDKALQLIDTIISLNPNNKVVKFMKGNIATFNRKEFISNF